MKFATIEAKEWRLKIGDFANEREAMRAIGLDPLQTDHALIWRPSGWHPALSVDPLPTISSEWADVGNTGHPVNPEKLALAVGAEGNTFGDHGRRWARMAITRRSAGQISRNAFRKPAGRQSRQPSQQMTDSTLEMVLRRDRLIVAGALGIVVALA
jgi:hypothetical protein